jgi:hypothetical protein
MDRQRIDPCCHAVAMVTGAGRLRLSSGAVRSRTAKIVMWVISGPILACLAGFVGAFIVVIIGDTSDSTSAWAAVVAAIAFIAADPRSLFS